MSFRDEYEHVVFVLSDLHIGSPFGVTPSGWVVERMSGGFSVNATNNVYEIYTSTVKVMSDAARGANKRLLLLLGDIIDGNKHTDDFNLPVDAQIEAAHRVLKETIGVLGVKRVIIVRGTPAHDSYMERVVASGIGADVSVMQHAFINVGGITIDAAHAGIVSANSKSALNYAVNYAAYLRECGKDVPDVIVRGHSHKPARVEYETLDGRRVTAAFCPPFCLNSTFMHSRSSLPISYLGGAIVRAGKDYKVQLVRTAPIDVRGFVKI